MVTESDPAARPDGESTGREDASMERVAVPQGNDPQTADSGGMRSAGASDGAAESVSEASRERSSGAASGAAKAPPVRQRTGSGPLAHVAFWLSLVAVAAAVATWFLTVPSVGSLQSEATRRLQAVEQRLDQLESGNEPVQAGLRDLRDRVAVLERRGADVAGLQAQIEKLYRNLAEDSTDVLLADVESALVLASQQLSLGIGAPAVLAALQALDERLARQDDPGLQPVRAALMTDIERLQSYPAADVVSLALRIDALMDAIGSYPLLSSVTAPDSTAQEARSGRLGALRSEFERLIRVRRVDHPEAMLLAPEQAYFVRENLSLLLLNARLSLLSRNESLFRSDIERALEWLRTWYDVDDRSVASAIARLGQLPGAHIALAPPTLADSIAAVRAARAARTMREAIR